MIDIFLSTRWWYKWPNQYFCFAHCSSMFWNFISFCWPDINRNITLYCINFPFFHLIIVFWLEWKSTRQPLLIFSSICLFSFCCVFISISIFKIYLCAAVSVSLLLYAHCYLTVKFIPAKRLCYFVFILSLSFCSNKPVTLFIFGNNYYIHTMWRRIND